MLDRNLIRTEPDRVRQGAANKRVEVNVDRWLEVDRTYIATLKETESLNAERNSISKQIGALMSQGKKEEAESAKARTVEIKEALAEAEPRLAQLEKDLIELEQAFPNLAHESVPVGFTEDENVVVRTWGEPPVPSENPIPHWESALQMGMLDFERASKISGTGFALYTGPGARLQRALFNFMIDHQTLTNGYHEIYPPAIVNTDSLFGTGQLPKFEEDLFKVDEGRYLIPTAEVPVTNIYRDEILSADQVPMKMAAYSPCFRREAGSAGKDTRGIQRMHQFDKVELVKYARPEDSYNELESLTKDACSLLEALGIHHRVTLLCTGEMSFGNAKCYDLEIWSPGMNKYLEVSSCSNFEAFQARRANIRFRREPGAKPEFVHTLNGSGVACPRLFIVLLETFFKPGVGFAVPEPLQDYVKTKLVPVL
ncbi:MAG: serine--tRNA ligase [Armatimonadetes bacterium]|nr:serine--tRNA ligase [Armatimonadota bacterium]